MKHIIGTDIIEINRIAESIKNDKFIQNIFTKKEQELASSRGNKAEFYAGRYAAKEAIYKAVNQVIDSHVSWRDVEILYENKAPKVYFLHDDLKEFNDKISLSISHDRETAIATALLVLD